MVRFVTPDSGGWGVGRWREAVSSVGLRAWLIVGVLLAVAVRGMGCRAAGPALPGPCRLLAAWRPTHAEALLRCCRLWK